MWTSPKRQCSRKLYQYKKTPIKAILEAHPKCLYYQGYGWVQNHHPKDMLSLYLTKNANQDTNELFTIVINKWREETSPVNLHDLIRIIYPHKEAHARSWFIGHIKVVTTDQTIKISKESPIIQIHWSICLTHVWWWKCHLQTKLIFSTSLKQVVSVMRLRSELLEFLWGDTHLRGRTPILRKKTAK